MTSPRKRLTLASVGGFVLSAVCILGGLELEKGELRDIGQITAALIVIGGTAGALIVGTPTRLLLRALGRLSALFFESREDGSAIVSEMVRYLMKARRSGIGSLESELEEIGDPFLRRAIMLLIDGLAAAEIRRIMEMDLTIAENEAEADAKVFEAAGGFAPTIGIIGAVMGLIQVMKHLESIDDVGRGIAVAFVATIYGVGLANLILLPIAARIRSQAALISQLREMIVEGVVAIHFGINPKLLLRMLEGYTNERTMELPLTENPETPTAIFSKAFKAS